MNNIEQKRVLVTGGAGYIGSHACKSLALRGYLPIVYDNLVYGHTRAVKWGPLEQGDIADRSRLDEVVSQYRPDAVMHFAAYAYVGESVKDPGKYYRNNVAGSLTLLETMRDHSIDKIIFSSSCSTYGNPEQMPISEKHPQQPINPYGASKLMIERMLQDFDHAHGFQYLALRYFNAAGADPDGEIGEDHDPEPHLIPIVIHTALGHRTNIEIYGTDYPTTDGTAIRDYIHVTDLAEAHVQALEYLIKGGNSTALNLGTGRGYSVKEIVQIAESVSGRHISAKNVSRRDGDPPVLVADATRAVNLLKWHPAYSDIENILTTAWQWHEKQHNA